MTIRIIIIAVTVLITVVGIALRLYTIRKVKDLDGAGPIMPRGRENRKRIGGG